MNKFKEKEENLFQSLSKLDSITDLVVNSKKKIIDLEQVRLNLETEKLSLFNQSYPHWRVTIYF